MKVCYLGDNGSVHNQKWIEALSKRNDMQLHVVTFDNGVKFQNVNYHYLKKVSGSKLDYLLNVKHLRKILSEINPDLLHAHYATSYGYMGTRTRFHPYVITGWGADIFDSVKNPVMRSVVRTALSSADALTVLSEIAFKKVQYLTGRSADLIPFGVNVNQFRPAIRNEDGKFRIGTIRTLTEKYGVEYLIRAFAILYPKHSNIHLKIVGDGKLRDNLEQLCVNLNISDRVKFHGYVNQKAEPEKYYQILSGLDVFVIPSILDSETFGVAAVEASACGLPVIASDIGGLTEVVRHNETGIIVPPKDAEGIANAIGSLLIDPDRKVQMGRAGRERAVKLYNWDESVNKMMDVYMRVIK
jgi:glycosyltransferase involved in cell wall biosynthesis